MKIENKNKRIKKNKIPINSKIQKTVKFKYLKQFKHTKFEKIRSNKNFKFCGL